MKEYYLQKADENLPKLNKKKIFPDVKSGVLNVGDSLIIDLGNHYVGYFSFKMWYVDEYIDAPVRMKVSFCETEREIYADYSDYRSRLCKSWLQEEILNVDFPGVYKMPRRYAARYIKFDILHTPKRLSLSDFTFEAETSADVNALKPYETKDSELSAIDKVAVNTLKNCMQRVFEDGPKRDRRLWIGDLRLEALANYYSFKNKELVKRCLYLFAASDRNESGFMPGYVYENPIFVSGTWFLEDYSLMYVCTLCDYYQHTGDGDTFRDLFNVAASVMDAMEKTKNSRGLVTFGGNNCAFIDWCRGLNKNISLVGIYLYTLELWCNALEALGYREARVYRQRLKEGRDAAFSHLYDKEKQVFVNEWDGMQYSVHSTAWMVLGGVINGNEAQKSLLDAINSPDSVKPFTPYMHHYVVEALVRVGLNSEAEEYVRNIWGGMVKLGADTFFEAYVSGDPDFSPYGDWKVNSMCHAWSCTATYFIRKYGMGKESFTL